MSATTLESPVHPAQAKLAHSMRKAPLALTLAIVVSFAAACASPSHATSSPTLAPATPMPTSTTGGFAPTSSPPTTPTPEPVFTSTPAILRLADLGPGRYVVYCAADGQDERGDLRFALFVASGPNMNWGRLARGPCHAALSPDGHTLAYEARPGVNDLWIDILDLDTGATGTLSRSDGCVVGSWSPDGQWLAVGCRDGEIHLLSPEGLPSVVVTNCGLEGADCDRPAWSPDGSLLAFERILEFQARNGLYILSTSCISNPESCPQVTLYQGLQFGPYGWSPDSGDISFTRGQPEVGLLDLGSGSARSFAIDPQDFGGVIRSPDGEEYAYSDREQIFIAKDDGSRPVSITSGLTQKSVQFWLIIP
jgi:WD40 repeat protein